MSRTSTPPSVGPRSVRGRSRLPARRRRGALMAAAAALVAVAAGAVSSLPRADESPREELARRLEVKSDRPRFAIAYGAGGTRVNDCFLPNRRFLVFVDHRAETLVVARSAADQVPLAIWREGRVFVHRSLFRSGALSQPWLAVPSDLRGPAGEALRGILGVDLASYLLSDELPPTGRATAVAALEVAKSVRRVPSAAGESDRFSITVDPGQFEEATASAVPSSSTPTGPTSSVSLTPTIDVWLDNGDTVARIDVRAGDTGATRGWTVEYSPLTTAAPAIRAAEVADLTGVDLSSLTPSASPECELPL